MKREHNKQINEETTFDFQHLIMPHTAPRDHLRSEIGLRKKREKEPKSVNIFNRICMLAAMACASSMVVAKDIVVSSTAPYHDPVVIAENIKSECTDLGNNFVKSTKKYLQASGWQVTLGEGEVASVAGRAVELKIANAVSIGNWFSSHRKNVMITATLYENGEVVDSYTKTRNSNGGIAGSFKSSCAVLYRCVNTLGNDVAKWLNGKQ